MASLARDRYKRRRNSLDIGRMVAACIALSLVFCCGQPLFRDGSHGSTERVPVKLRHRKTMHASKLNTRRTPVPLAPEIWASGGVGGSRSLLAPAVSDLLNDTEKVDLRALCGRALWHSLTTAVQPRANGNTVFVATGDIDDMWIRDSTVQLSIYFPRLATQPALRSILEGAMRAQAFYILQDPYANAYTSRWRDPVKLSKADRIIGRGGWVATRNYELDSGAYFLSMLWNYFATPGIFGVERFLNETTLFDAAMLLVNTWTLEQRHEERSPYRYSELPRGGMGPQASYTGMSWSGYRPSDDPQTYSYNVPVNMYAVAALERALVVNDAVWHSSRFAAVASKLAAEMRAGIEAHGIVTHEDGSKSYAYEVDGRGGVLADFDDPNVPSLLSIPLLGFRYYDADIYANTRRRILSQRNKWYFSGPVLSGLGSPHTPRGYVWPLALMVGALTSKDPKDRATAFRQLLRAQCGNGLMHESVSAVDAAACTRPWFEWANAMYVVLYEDSFGERCDDAAEEHRLAGIRKREAGDTDTDPLWYETLEAGIRQASD
jgi:uncharacterized protein